MSDTDVDDERIDVTAVAERIANEIHDSLPEEYADEWPVDEIERRLMAMMDSHASRDVARRHVIRMILGNDIDEVDHGIELANYYK